MNQRKVLVRLDPKTNNTLFFYRTADEDLFVYDTQLDEHQECSVQRLRAAKHLQTHLYLRELIDRYKRRYNTSLVIVHNLIMRRVS